MAIRGSMHDASDEVYDADVIIIGQVTYIKVIARINNTYSFALPFI